MSAPRWQIPKALLAALHHGDAVPTLVAGIGSPHGSDQVGWSIAEQVAELNLPGVTVRRALVPLDLLDWIDDFATIHLLDAMQSNQQVGTVVRWDWPSMPDMSIRRQITHGYDLTSVLRLASALGRASATITIWGIEVAD